MDNSVGGLLLSRFFCICLDNDVWGYSSVVERMLCMYDVLGSIPSISSLNYLFPSVTFLYFQKTSIGLERFFPKWTIRQEQFWCQDFFGFALTRIRGDIAKWQSACFACMMSWVQSPVSPVLTIYSQVLLFYIFERHQLDWRGFSRNGQLGRSNFGVKIFLDLPWQGSLGIQLSGRAHALHV